MRKTLVLWFMFALLASSSIAGESQTIEGLLDEAEALKSSDQQALVERLEKLSVNRDKLTREQYFRYQYLTGYSRAFAGQPEQAITIYQEVLNGTQSDLLRVKVLRSVLNVYAIERDFVKAYMTANELQLSLSNISDISANEARVALAIFYNKAGDYPLAIQHVNDVVLSEVSPRTQCFVLSILVEAHFHLDSTLFIDAVDRAVDSCTVANEFVPSGLNLLFKAKHQMKTSAEPALLKQLKDIQQGIELTAYNYLIVEYYSVLSAIEFELGQYGKAEQSALKVLELSQYMGALEPKITAYRTLASVKQVSGQFALALDYYKRFAEAEKAYLDETKAKQLAIQQAKLESIQKANKIELLDKENTLLKIEAQLQKDERIKTQLIALLLGIIVVAVLVWAVRSRKVQRLLRTQAQQDGLTRIANRSYFTQCAEEGLAQASLQQQPVSFVILDLDHFKHINDNYGHTTGDWVLKNVASTLLSHLPSVPILGRLGGEEFAVLLPDCDLHQGFAVAEQLRQAIQDMKCNCTGFDFNVTASFGVSSSVQLGYGFDKLYSCADEALYNSKHEGRNQVYVYSQSEHKTS